MIKLRPHHLLCVHAFEGKGYSSEFTENMSVIVNSLLSDKNPVFKIISGPDDICHKCPNLINGKCRDFKKVKMFDRKTAKLLNIEDGSYQYKEIRLRLKYCLSDIKFRYICRDCKWFDSGICLKNIRKNFPLKNRGKISE